MIDILVQEVEDALDEAFNEVGNTLNIAIQKYSKSETASMYDVVESFAEPVTICGMMHLRSLGNAEEKKEYASHGDFTFTSKSLRLAGFIDVNDRMTITARDRLKYRDHIYDIEKVEEATSFRSACIIYAIYCKGVV
jgi:hypothetical protein